MSKTVKKTRPRGGRRVVHHGCKDFSGTYTELVTDVIGPSQWVDKLYVKALFSSWKGDLFDKWVYFPAGIEVSEYNLKRLDSKCYGSSVSGFYLVDGKPETKIVTEFTEPTISRFVSRPVSEAECDIDGKRETCYTVEGFRHYCDPRKVDIHNLFYVPERVDVRDTLVEAKKEYNSMGTVDVDVVNRETGRGSTYKGGYLD